MHNSAHLLKRVFIASWYDKHIMSWIQMMSLCVESSCVIGHCETTALIAVQRFSKKNDIYNAKFKGKTDFCSTNHNTVHTLCYLLFWFLKILFLLLHDKKPNSCMLYCCRIRSIFISANGQFNEKKFSHFAVQSNNVSQKKKLKIQTTHWNRKTKLIALHCGIQYSTMFCVVYWSLCQM